MNGKEVRVGASLLVGNMDNMVRFYRDILGFHTQWNGGSFADFETASGELSLFMYSREEFVKAIGKDYVPTKDINQTFEIALWLPGFVVKLRVVMVYFLHFSKHDSSHSQNIIKYVGMLLGEQCINKLSVSGFMDMQQQS